jgi:hypothetical protein
MPVSNTILANYDRIGTTDSLVYDKFGNDVEGF